MKKIKELYRKHKNFIDQCFWNTISMIGLMLLVQEFGLKLVIPLIMYVGGKYVYNKLQQEEHDEKENNKFKEEIKNLGNIGVKNITKEN